MPGSRSASSDYSDEKKHGVDVPKHIAASSELDVAAQLTAGSDFVLDPAEAERVRYVSIQGPSLAAAV